MFVAEIETPSPHAFISYVRDDATLVDELERVLTAAGIPVWRDVRDLFPGDNWRARIREAIQQGALAFVPVFSEASEARPKSVMREEILLAIAEYRLMAPNSSFIFPVRLKDDVVIPTYEISATQSLRDINWTDFFGTAKTVQATQLVARLRAVLGDRGRPSGAPNVAAETSDQARGPLITSAVRDGLSNPGRAAEAAQMLTEEARRVVELINEARTRTTDSRGGTILQAFDRYVQMRVGSLPLVDGMTELGARGRAADASLAARLVAGLARAGFANGSGVQDDWLASITRLPAILALLGGAVGATSTHNADMIAALINQPTVPMYGQMLSVARVLSPWNAFAPSWEFAQFIDLRETKSHVEVTEDVIRAYERRDVRRVSLAPASDVLRRALWPVGSRFAIDEEDFASLVHRTEMLVSAVLIDDAQDRDQSNHFSDWDARNWVGGHAGRERYARNGLADDVASELGAAGSSWWPLAGGLFGGDPKRAAAAIARYADYAAEAARDRSYR